MSNWQPAVAAETAEVLIVDDDEALRRWARRVMEDNGYVCEGAASAREARERMNGGDYSLVLLDVNMPGESGMDLLAAIREQHPATAVLMVTGADDRQTAMAAIEQGAYGYMVKPVRAGELLINVANALFRRQREREGQRTMDRLQHEVEDRNHELVDALQDLQLSRSRVWVSQAETIFRLARLVEFRDEETGQHVQRMSSYCELLSRRLGMARGHSEMVRLASQLHDVGKVAIPDTILQKPGRLTPDERATIETHAQIGYEMLAGSTSEVVQLGGVIARTHHERWDGAGYPRNLSGDEIPAEGRIAAIADVFDALTSTRCYRPAFPVGQAIETMRCERAEHFDPAMLDAFIGARSEVEAVRRTYAD